MQYDSNQESTLPKQTWVFCINYGYCVLLSTLTDGLGYKSRKNKSIL